MNQHRQDRLPRACLNRVERSAQRHALVSREVQPEFLECLASGGVHRARVLRIDAPPWESNLARPRIFGVSGPLDEEELWSFGTTPKDRGDGSVSPVRLGLDDAGSGLKQAAREAREVWFHGQSTESTRQLR